MVGEKYFLRYHRYKARRSKRKFPISIFTITLVTFACLWAVLNIFTINGFTNCEYAALWISGWFDGISPFHNLGAAILLFSLVWLLRLITSWRELNPVETLLQFFLISCLIISFITLKATLFPYGTPNRDLIYDVVRFGKPPFFVLEESVNREPRPPGEWNYDYPKPPASMDKWDYLKAKNKRFDQIFTSENSPTWKEYNAMYVCIADFREAVEFVEQSERDYQEWYDEHGWRVNLEDLY